jgi:hypothetical protein
MSFDPPDDVNIPLVFLWYQEGDRLLSALSANPDLVVKMSRGAQKVQIVYSIRTMNIILHEIL